MTESVGTIANAARHTAFVIIVNAAQHTAESPLVSYEQVVGIAYPTPPTPDTRFTVTYRKAVAPSHEGSLVAGQSVEVKKKGTIFNVKATGRS
ncbi:MAG: multiubiquitin domain-containing protein [Jatrophihabitantaceae bacterium]